MEHWLDRGGRFDRFTRWVAFLGLMGLLVVALGTMGDVLLRWLFNAPIEGFEEVSELTFAIIVAACFPAGLIQGHNITIRLLGKGLGKRADQWLEAFGAALTLTFFVIVVWQIFVFALDETLNSRFTQTLEMLTGPWWWLVSGVIVICVPVQVLVTLVAVMRAVTGRAPDAAAHEEMPDFMAGIEIDSDEPPGRGAT
jgi:TRAP-type C4-dicarboxylate transport system permease small subunit